MIPTTLEQLSLLVGGEYEGPAELLLDGAAPIHEAKAGQITLVDRADRMYLLRNTPAAAVVVPKSVTECPLPAIRADDVHQAFSAIVSFFRPPRAVARKGIHPSAIVSPTAELGDDVDIHAYAVIGDGVRIGCGSTIHSGVRILDQCRIGRNVEIFPNAVLYENTVVGDNCRIHAGVVLGAYGFGYVCRDGRHELAAQLGNVVVENDVEIGANTTIDRGTYGATVIGEGTKIDNQVMVAHNCRIGRHNMLCAQVGIAGSTTTGDYVVMAGQVGVRDHVHIGDGAVLGAMAGVIHDIPPHSRYVGIPATPEREQMLKQAAFAKLPEMRRQLKELQETVRRLSTAISGEQREAA